MPDLEALALVDHWINEDAQGFVIPGTPFGVELMYAIRQVVADARPASTTGSDK